MTPTPMYRERLSPSLWILATPLVMIPMIALVFLRENPTLALVIATVAAAAVIAGIYALAPVVEVRDGVLRAGRAHIDTALLGTPTAFTNDEARAARGRNLDARAWHLIRGGIDGIVTIPVTDPADPTPAWVVSSRTPDRLAAAIGAAQLTQRTPGKSDR